jgi:CAAX protease family protein
VKNIFYPITYVVIALGCSWAYTAFVFSRPERVQHYPFIMFIPASVALALSFVQHRSLSHLLRPIVRQPRLSIVLFAFVFPVLVIVACAFLAEAFGVASYQPGNLQKLLAIKNTPVAMILLGILATFGEEYGWRGYLLPELCKTMRPVVATLCVGIVWALWHGPLLFNLAKVMGTGNPCLVAGVQMCAVIVFSFPFAYTFLQSGSIFPPIIFHYVWNYFNPIVLGNVYRNRIGIMSGNILLINGEGMLGIVVGSLFVAWFVYHYRGQTSPHIAD